MPMLSTKEAAKFLGLKEATLRGWRCAGIGPAFYTISARRIMYDEADLRAFKSERRCVPMPHSEGLHAAFQKTA